MPPASLRAKVLDAAGFGERLDEGVLLFDRPAVAPRAERDGLEGDESFGFVHMVHLEPYWNTKQGV
jgi:hypothetical protein